MSLKIHIKVSPEDSEKLAAFLEANPELGRIVAPSPDLYIHAAADSSPESLKAADSWLAQEGDPEFEPYFGENEEKLGPGYWTHTRGASALTIYSFFRRDPEVTLKVGARVDHPLDDEDFGRCVELLNAVPEWRARIEELAILSPAWSELSRAWSAIELAYKAGNKPEATRLLAESLKDI